MTDNKAALDALNTDFEKVCDLIFGEQPAANEAQDFFIDHADTLFTLLDSALTTPAANTGDRFNEGLTLAHNILTERINELNADDGSCEVMNEMMERQKIIIDYMEEPALAPRQVDVEEIKREIEEKHGADNITPYMAWAAFVDGMQATLDHLAQRNLLAAAPTQGKFKLGDRVQKKGNKGQWHGKIVGFYRASCTPVGYAVESERETGSVQIYPEDALEAAPTQDTKGEE